jgi:hypothetical protein
MNGPDIASPSSILRLKVDGRRIQLTGALDRRERNREVLDR